MMFIFEKPYVSELLLDTVVQNDWAVLENDSVKEADIEEGAIELCSPQRAIEYYQKQEFPLIYSNSEHGTAWVTENLPNSNLSSYIKMFKDKFEFRELIKDLYPDFYYSSIEYSALQNVKKQEIKYPIVIKPAVGFLSLGVHTIHDVSEWDNALSKIKKEMQYATSVYTEDVINSSKFIIEEMIEGEEYAVDAYFDRNGDVVILNIFHHPLANSKDVRDRIYTISADIMIRYMAKFALVLRDIGNLKNIRNLAIHCELRVKSDGIIIPIEINPMRFAGWCNSDIAKYAWGINVYKYFYEQKRPDWNEILTNADKSIYYFSMAEVPTDFPNEKIKEFSYADFLANYSNVLEFRRINYRKHPIFGIIFGKTDNQQEIKRILSLNTINYVVD